MTTKYITAALAVVTGQLLMNPSASATPVQWTGAGSNGHYYEICQANGTNVPPWGGLSWTEANSLAIAAGGYLATITSAHENSFIAALLESSTANRAWLGGSDSATEGTWIWINGSEAGDVFSFTNWNPGEPNNNTQTYVASGGPPNPEGEDFVEMYSSRINNASGRWNDLPNNGTPGIAYVVEYDVAPIPQLRITTPTSSQAALSWPTNADGYALETTFSLPASSWNAVTNVPVVLGNSFSVTIPATNTQQYFRLYHQ